MAKTVVLVTPGGYARATIPASARLDLEKVRDVLGAGMVRLATEEELAEVYPRCELGAVPPLWDGADPIVVDIRLCGSDELLFDAGTHDWSIRLTTSRLLELADATVADVCTG